MKVAKFGGSSLANGAQIQKVIDIIKSDSNRRIVVVSAPGKRKDTDTKVTDLLIKYCNTVSQGEDITGIQNKIIKRYQAIAGHFGLPDTALEPIVEGITKLATQVFPSRAYQMAAFKAAGENNNAKLIAAIFNHQQIPAEYLDPKTIGLTVTDVPDDAQILPSSYEKLAQTLTQRTKVAVVPGFFGYNTSGEVCTFSRGGSDVTGAILARAVAATEYENFTDVDAIYAANPNIVPNPKKITNLTFREMRELSYAGFSVFHDEALIPAIEGKIPVVVKNTNHPSLPGTLISEHKKINHDDVVAGIASDSGFTGIYIRKYLMNKQVGFTLKLLEILAKLNISYEHMPSGIDDLTIIIRSNQLTPELETQIRAEIESEIHPDDFQIQHNYTMVMIVGEGIQDRVGTMAAATASIAQAGVSIVMVNHGASPVSITFGIRTADADAAVQGLYDTFIAHQPIEIFAEKTF
ncbi:aspartate kinase [Agrilactobacillus fermenti]|uniref:aspartate kinase n=1 Tax=Agrilactobacillus fermenti TaxID=2586909 RepID=UPI001E3647E0|nr:aspartate kinase [Agrilactobacillus fermenti]MCD2255321.1 aspartate kinase [Agrilactobacillus fermenti]